MIKNQKRRIENNKDSFSEIIKVIKNFKRNLDLKKQQSMEYPTDPEEIHRRAEFYRKELEKEKILARQLEEDLQVIRYWQRMHPEEEKSTLSQKIWKKIKKGDKL
jgi:sialic acid synthase SpsE